MDPVKTAPSLVVDQWVNTDQPIDLGSLLGKVVVIEAFQMLCPGCVAHGIPQAHRIDKYFPETDVEVLGLHAVFEHHAAMTPVALAAFVSEYRVSFPVGIDRPTDTGIPETMRAYELQGTPTLIVIDRQGRLRHRWFGAISDLAVGNEIARLVQDC